MKSYAMIIYVFLMISCAPAIAASSAFNNPDNLYETCKKAQLQYATHPRDIKKSLCAMHIENILEAYQSGVTTYISQLQNKQDRTQVFISVNRQICYKKTVSKFTLIKNYIRWVETKKNHTGTTLEAILSSTRDNCGIVGDNIGTEEVSKPASDRLYLTCKASLSEYKNNPEKMRSSQCAALVENILMAFAASVINSVYYARDEQDRMQALNKTNKIFCLNKKPIELTIEEYVHWVEKNQNIYSGQPIEAILGSSKSNCTSPPQEIGFESIK